MTPTKLTRADKWVALALAVVAFAITLAASRTQGVHRDEAYYMRAGEQYAIWMERAVTGELKQPLSKGSIDAYWGYNYEHPPLMKVLYGLSWRLLHKCDCAADQALHPGVSRLKEGRHRSLGLTSEITAFRAPTMVCFAILIALVWLWSVEATGSRLGALAAAGFVALQPRMFFHAQTASFDLPAALFWVATTYAYWRALAGGWKRAVVVGVLYGLFLATKLQSFFLPLALGVHWLAVGVLGRWGRARARWPSALPFVAMAVLGPLVVFLLWPLLWHDPMAQLDRYFSFHLKHVHYNFEYLGENWNRPPYPWHEPLGMLIFTAPLTLLACAIGGTVVLAREGLARLRGTMAADPRATAALWAVAGFVPIAIFFPGTAPIFGETKHWLATTAFLALAGGVAIGRLAPRIVAELRARGRGAEILTGALVACALVPAAIEVVRSHPYGLSHYNALAGGAPGGADLGMNRQFWGYAPNGLFGTLAQELKPKARLYPHDMNPDTFDIVLRDGRLRRDIVDAGMEDGGIRSSDAALVVHELHFAKYDYMIWQAYGSVAPRHVLTLDGVPLVSLYEKVAR